MGIKQYKPTSAGRRYMSVSDFSEVTKNETPENLLTPFIRVHLNYVIPMLGKLITGEAEAYTYLPDTTKGFLSAEELAVQMKRAGFQTIGFKRLMFGTIAVHWGIK